MIGPDLQAALEKLRPTEQKPGTMSCYIHGTVPDLTGLLHCEACSGPAMNEQIDYKIAWLCLKAMADAFDRLVAECMDGEGKPKAPSYKVLMQSRGFLPPHCPTSLCRKDAA